MSENATIAEKLGYILKAYTNGYGGGNDPAVVHFYKILEKLPAKAVHQALDEYLLFPGSQFYDQGKLITLVQKYIALDMGLPDANAAWVQVQSSKRAHGAYQTPAVHPLVLQAIDYFGGWGRFIDNVSERDFLRVYNDHFLNATKKVILDATVN